MKKVLLTTGLLGAITMASASMTFTTGSTSIKDGKSGPSFGIQLTKDYGIGKGFSIGPGFGIEYFKFKAGNVNEHALVTEFYPKLTYSVGKFDLYTLAGYSFGAIDKEYFKGATYGGGIDYNFNKRFGLGVGYKHTKININGGGPKMDADRFNVGLKWTL